MTSRSKFDDQLCILLFKKTNCVFYSLKKSTDTAESTFNFFLYSFSLKAPTPRLELGSEVSDSYEAMIHSSLCSSQQGRRGDRDTATRGSTRLAAVKTTLLTNWFVRKKREKETHQLATSRKDYHVCQQSISFNDNPRDSASSAQKKFHLKP